MKDQDIRDQIARIEDEVETLLELDEDFDLLLLRRLAERAAARRDLPGKLLLAGMAHSRGLVDDRHLPDLIHRPPRRERSAPPTDDRPAGPSSTSASRRAPE